MVERGEGGGWGRGCGRVEESVGRGWWKRVLEEVMEEVVGGSDGSDGG